MTEPQPQPSADVEAATEQADESRAQTSTLVTARLLANPRRVRRA
jgi:hypothetical protein